MIRIGNIIYLFYEIIRSIIVFFSDLGTGFSPQTISSLSILFYIVNNTTLPFQNSASNSIDV